MEQEGIRIEESSHPPPGHHPADIPLTRKALKSAASEGWVMPPADAETESERRHESRTVKRNKT